MPFITNNQNAMFYECGFSCDNGIFFKKNDQAFFITDSRYTLEAKENIKNKNIEVITSSNLIEDLIKIAKGINKIIFDPSQISLETYNKISQILDLTAESNFHQKLRIIKNDDEIKMIKKSQELNKKAFKKFAKFLSKNSIEGKNELFLNFKAKEFLSKNGKYDLSFDPITALNHNAAKPHALPNKDKIKIGDVLLFDAGIKYKRYCSDMTRTALYDGDIEFNKKQKLPKKIQKIYDIVLKAQELTIKKARSGMKAKDIDFIARDYITKAGYGEFFTHSTGHGIGLDIHELPIISHKSETIIEDGMIFSIEPGIYLNNEFGIRIEDLVLMKNGKAEIL